MQFFVFILDNIVHYLQPAAFWPELEAVPIYQVLTLLCLVLSYQQVARKLKAAELVKQPIVCCALLILIAAPLANLSHVDLYGARKAVGDYLKALIYFLLLIALVDTPTRLRQFLFVFTLLGLTLTILPLLQHHGYLNVESLAALQERDYDPSSFEEHYVTRLRTLGVFHDPNDFCLLLIATMMLCAYWATDKAGRILMPLWIIGIGLCFYALLLTQSRGGLVAFMVSGWVFTGARFGWKKAILIGAAAAPAILVGLAGRQASIDLGAEEGSGQSRVLLWRDGIEFVLDSPLFGIGIGQYLDQAGQVAHNTYLHCLAEMGLFGGPLYIGMFVFGLTTLYRLGSAKAPIADAQLARLRPYLFGIVAAYATGMLSLSRHFVVPTYMILGLVSTFCSQAQSAEVLPRTRFGLAMWLKWMGVSFAYLLAMSMVVRTFAR